MNSQAQNKTEDLSNEMIRLIARNLRDTNASRLKAVSKRFRGTVYAKSHPTILNKNNGYNSNNSFIRPSSYYQEVNGKKISKRNHENFKEKQRAASMLPANRVPVKRESRLYENGEAVFPLQRTKGYFSSKTGSPYSKIRPIPHSRRFPYGRTSPPRDKPRGYKAKRDFAKMMGQNMSPDTMAYFNKIRKVARNKYAARENVQAARQARRMRKEMMREEKEMRRQEKEMRREEKAAEKAARRMRKEMMREMRKEMREESMEAKRAARALQR